MPTQSLDKSFKQFPPKTRNPRQNPISSQNMRGHTSHNRFSSSNLLGEKGDVLYLKTSTLGVYVPIKCQASHDPVISVMFYLDGAKWILLISLIHCIYELCLLRKVVVEIVLEIKSLAELFIASCILMQIYSVFINHFYSFRLLGGW